MPLNEEVLRELYGDQPDLLANPFPAVKSIRPDAAVQGLKIERSKGIEDLLAAKNLPQLQDELDQDNWDAIVKNAPSTAKLMATKPAVAAAIKPEVGVFEGIESTIKSIFAGGSAKSDRTALSFLQNIGSDISGFTNEAARAPVALAHSAGTHVLEAGAALPVLYGKATNDTTAQDWYFKNILDQAHALDSYLAPPDKPTFSEALGGGLGNIATLIPVARAVSASYAAPTAVASMGPTIKGMIAGAVENGVVASAMPALNDALTEYSNVYQHTGSVAQAVQSGLARYFGTTAMFTAPATMAGGLATRVASGAAAGVASGEAVNSWMNLNSQESMRHESSGMDLLLNGIFGAGFGVFGPHGREYSDTQALLRKTYDDAAKADQAQQNFAMLGKLGELSQAAQLRKDDPESFRQVVAGLKAGDGNLYVDVDRFNEVFNQMPRDQAEAVLQQMPEVTKQLREAEQTNGIVRILLEDYAAHISGSEIDKAMAPHLKAAPDAITQEQSQLFYQEQGARFMQEAQRLAGEREAQTPLIESRKAVVDDVLQQLNTVARFNPAVNKTNAELYASFITMQAQRAGMLPADFHAKYGAKVVGDLAAQANHLDQRNAQIETPEFKNWFGDSKVVDAEGKPLVVYHGAPDARFMNEDATFKNRWTGSTQGAHWFTPSQKTAGTYADDRRAFEYQNAEPAVIPAYLSLNNPLVIDAAGAHWRDAQKHGKTADVIKEAQTNGHDGVIIRNVKDDYNNTGGTKPTDTYVVFDSSQIKHATQNNGNFDPNEPSILHQAASQGKNKKPLGSYDPESRTVALLQAANFSTFAHESGHFFLDTYARMAADPNAHAVIKGDMDTLLKWFGVESLDKWHALSLDEQRQFHEKFAEGFEMYLFEGKAPSVELRGIFGRFASWLKQVYKSVSGMAPINDEIRSVMDRMLASEDQIHQAEKARGYEALFRSAEEAAKFGMGPEAWQEYIKDNAEATGEAVDYLQKRSLADMQWLSNAKSKALKALQREAKDKRTEIADAVMHEVSALPEYQARNYLKANKIKIDADGNYPDDVADKFGFSSGAEMTAKLRDTEPLKERVQAMTDLQMLERHGELVDPQAIERAAEAAIHNDMRARVMATELSALTRAMGNVSALMRGARDAAMAAIGAKRILDIRPASYTTSEARAQREADHAMRKLQDPDTAYRSAFTREKNARLEEGRTPEEADAFAAHKGEEARAKAQDKVDANGGRTPLEIAAQAKRAALLNNRLAKAAGDALDEVNKGVAYFRRMQSTGAQKNMRGDALEQLSALLGRFDLRTSRARSDIEANRMPLKDWVVQEADRLTAIAPDLPAFVLNENYRKHYKEMTIDEFRALVDSVKQLEFMARREQTQYLAIRNQSFQQERTALLDVLRRNFPKLFEADGTPKGMPEHFAPTIGRGLSKLGDKFLGEFLSPENIVSVLERGELGGVHESLIQRISHREEWKAERLGGIFKKMEPLFKAYSLKERMEFGRKGYYIKEIDNTITRENAVMVALLYGNKEGRERLLNYGWNERQAQAIMHILDGRDLDLAKGVWDLFDNDLWPELKALNERTRGKAPPKVEATPYNVNEVDMPGGYMRLKYDNTLDERIYRLEEGAAVKEMLGGTASGYGAKTNQGASNERQQGVKLRPRLDLNVMAEAINETVHDVAFREAVADTMRMLNDRGVTSALKQAAGEAGYRALVNKVRQVAAIQRDPSGFIEKSLTVARKNTVVNLMSGVYTALQNFTGIASSFTRVDAGLLAGEIAKFYSPDMVERVHFAMDQSAYMRQRFTSYDRDLQIAMKKLTVNGKIMPDTASFLWLMGMVDRGVAVPTWNAAFKEGMGKFANDRDKAVEWADHIVRQTQGSGREIDLPQLMSGRGPLGALKKVFTMFHQYFNGQLGLLVVHGAIAKHQAQTNPYSATAEFTAKMLLMTAVPPVLTQFLMHGSESDDGKAKKWVKIIGLYGAQMFPLVRDAASFAVARIDPDSKHHNTSFRLSPIESLAESVLYKLPVALADMAHNGGNDKDLKDAIMGMGFLFGLPGKLIADTTLGTKAWTEGKAGPEAAVLGPPKK